jgi:hypothetical protein
MWSTIRRIAENVAGVFLGVLVTIALRHDLILGCIAGLIVCAVIIVACAQLEGRLKQNASSVATPQGLTLAAKGRVIPNIPDFSQEWAERQRLLQRYTGSVEVPDEVWAWANSVYNKLFAWKPKRAMEFRPDLPAATPVSNLRYVIAGISAIVEGSDTNLSRQNLILYGNRLAKIFDEESKNE